jgi:carboxylesterase type B
LLLLDLNAGLLDQLVALQFVKEAISKVGGDPKKVSSQCFKLSPQEVRANDLCTQVTLAGESAGALSTAYHLVFQDQSNDLFRAAIMMSGTPSASVVNVLCVSRGTL